MNEKILANEVKNWFNERAGDKNKWNRNLVGQTIKNCLKNLGNWKNAPRGNPAKGKRVALENKMKRECNW